MDRSQIDQVRRFNRAVTLRTGALSESYLGRGRPLGQARLLFEVGPDGSDIASLRESLGLDSGYASRLLKSLEADGLVAIRRDGGDKRRRLVTLTAKGSAERAAYDALSDGLAHSLLDTLGPSQRQRLVNAMAEVETLLNAGSVTIAAEPEDSSDAQRCVAAYFEELDNRFENGFDPGNGGYAGKPAAANVGRHIPDRQTARTRDWLRRAEIARRRPRARSSACGWRPRRAGSAWRDGCSRHWRRKHARLA